MTETLLKKIEERVLTLLNELEIMRNEIVRLRQENTLLRDDKDLYEKKLQGLITLLDVLESQVQAEAV